MILKTYARLFVRSLDESLPILEKLVGRPADLRFMSDDPTLLDPIVGDLAAGPLGSGEVEQAAIGDFLVIAGEAPELARARCASGPVVVASLRDTTRDMVAAGAVVVIRDTDAGIGTFNYLRHPDGALIEYIEWNSETVARILGPR